MNKYQKCMFCGHYGKTLKAGCMCSYLHTEGYRWEGRGGQQQWKQTVGFCLLVSGLFFSCSSRLILNTPNFCPWNTYQIRVSGAMHMAKVRPQSSNPTSTSYLLCGLELTTSLQYQDDTIPSGSAKQTKQWWCLATVAPKTRGTYYGNGGSKDTGCIPW